MLGVRGQGSGSGVGDQGSEVGGQGQGSKVLKVSVWMFESFPSDFGALRRCQLTPDPSPDPGPRLHIKPLFAPPST